MKTNVLAKTQISLLEILGQNAWVTENFYLTGGTALAGFYLGHRYSEDLDFFTETEFNPSQTTILLSELQKKFGKGPLNFAQENNRNLYFLRIGNEEIKLEFTYYPFPRIEKGPKDYNISLDSLIDIAVNKLFTIYQRSKARDYIDLYAICKQEQWTIKDLVAKVRIKFDWHIDPVQLGTQFTKAIDVKDYPRMIQNIPNKEWQNFFKEEAKKLGGAILS